jgi:hypothetical protein
MRLIASCIFYMAFIPAYILILFVAITIDYVAGILSNAPTAPGVVRGSSPASWPPE